MRYVRALGTAIKFFRDPANRPAAVKIIVETTGSSAEIAEQTLKLFFEPERNVLPRQAEININGLVQVITFMGDAGTVKKPLPAAERFVDVRYLRAAGIK